jgi:hypothetical protein
MATFTKVILSGSTDGRPIKVTQVATAGDTIHTAHATAIDEIYLYACNTSGAAILLTIEFGGVASPDDLVEFNIPPESGLFCVIPGLPLTNSLVVKAFAASANLITILGFVNRIA